MGNDFKKMVEKRSNAMNDNTKNREEIKAFLKKNRGSLNKDVERFLQRVVVILNEIISKGRKATKDEVRIIDQALAKIRLKRAVNSLGLEDVGRFFEREVEDVENDVQEEKELKGEDNICNNQREFNKALYRGLNYVEDVDSKRTLNMVLSFIWIVLIFIAVWRVTKLPADVNKPLHFILAVLAPPIYLAGEWVSKE